MDDSTEGGRPEGRAAGLDKRLAGGIVFFASGAVLVLEVVGLRLLAPYVGVSLQSSSAVIGMALAAIALGAWNGGRAADSMDPRRLLPPTLLAAGVLTAVSLPLVRWLGPSVQGDSPPAIALLAFLAVFAPSVSLAAVPPMVVKLQLRELGLTGTVVGRLSGIGTLGGIVATFATGFVLLAELPSTVIVLGLAGLTMVLGVVLGLAWRGGRPSAGMILLCVASAAMPGLAPSPCTTETAYHCARVLDDPSRPTGRLLILDNLAQSYVDLGDPTHLEFPYTQTIASVADVEGSPGQPIRVLDVGAGGLTLPRYIAATRPGSLNRVLEIDPGVIAIDRGRLRMGSVTGLSVDVGDARVALSREPARSRDLVIGDAFSGLAVPWHLTTREAAAQIARILRPDGVYAVNIIDLPPNRFVRAEVATLHAVFPQLAVVASSSALAGRAGGNFVLLASARPLPLGPLQERLAERGTPVTVASGSEALRFAGASPVLTDDYAPVDQLITHGEGV